jgi:hypothetical protein
MATQAQAQETAPALVEANVFELRRGKTRITFKESTADAARKPVLEYDDGQGAPLLYTGDQIRQEKTALGRLLSFERVLLDVRAPTMTLVLPTVLLEADKPEKFTTFLVVTSRGEGPVVVSRPLGPGPVESYNVEAFRGTARHVVRQTFPR